MKLPTKYNPKSASANQWTPLALTLFVFLFSSVNGQDCPPPSWYESEDSLKKPGYHVAIGSGVSLEDAKNEATASLAKTISTEISSQTTLKNKIIEQSGQHHSQEELVEAINIASQMTLRGIKPTKSVKVCDTFYVAVSISQAEAEKQLSRQDKFMENIKLALEGKLKVLDRDVSGLKQNVKQLDKRAVSIEKATESLAETTEDLSFTLSLVKTRIGDLPRFDKGAELHRANGLEAAQDAHKMEKLKTECNKNNVASCDKFIRLLCKGKEDAECHRLKSNNRSIFEKGCSLNLGRACMKLSGILEANNTTDLISDNSVALLDKGENLLDDACRIKKDASACSELGNYFWGQTETGTVRAISFFKRGCELGDGNACAIVAFSLAVSRNELEPFVEFSEKACFAKDPESIGCRDLGVLHEKGTVTSVFTNASINHGVPISFPKAHHFYSRACKLQDGEGCSYLGMLYQFGRGVKESWDKALSFYKAGCDFKNGWSCVNAGWLLSQPNLANWEPCYQHNAQEGRCSLTKHSIKQSPAKAAEFYSRACNLKYADGCWRLGGYFQTGFGVVKSDELAKQYFQQSENLRKREITATNNSKPSEGPAPSLIRKTISFFSNIVNGK